jgi:hypothetical protein
MMENDQKLHIKTYISVTSSSSLGFIYLRASHRIQGKKDDMSLNPGRGHWAADQEVYFLYTV